MNPKTRPVTSLIAVALASVALASPASAVDTITFTDGTFGPGWSSFKLFDTTAGASATFSSSTLPAGGNPGDYRETTHTFGAGAIGVAHLTSLYQHSPSVQPIQTISFNVELNHFTFPTTLGAVGYQLLLQQGNAYYAGVQFPVMFTGWQFYQVVNQPASAFTLVAGTGPANPDFSCTGGPINFGFLSSNSGSGLTTKTSGIDNWTVVLNVYSTTYSDGGFNPADWTSVKVFDTTPGAGASSTSTTWNVFLPSAYRETTHNWNNGAIIVSHESATATHQPSVSPFHSITFSARANHLTAGTIGGAVGLRAAVMQGSAYYAGPTINVFSGLWVQYSQALLFPSDFTLISGTGPVHPDFSFTGALVRFGYMTSNSASGGPVTKVIGIDDWAVRLNHTPPCSGTVGTPLCTGDDFASPCPCISFIPPGSPNRGCPNSVYSGGGLLIATGNPSLANDTLLLHGGFMPNGFSQFIQGTLLTGTPFGDGRLCVGGTIVRLGLKQNGFEAAHYPGNVDPPVSVQGLVSAPGQRLYQIWYRDAANFCTTATFNLSNALLINWTP